MADANEPKAKDLLREEGFGRRRRLGERTLERVGGRGWNRPNVACSGRIFKKYRLHDPWVPGKKGAVEDPIKLGPVSLKLGRERRQPAPHLKPRETASEKKKKAAHDPVAKWRRPANTPKPKSQQAASTPPTPPPKPTSSGLFGPGKKEHGLKGGLPVRPDLQAATQARAKAERKKPIGRNASAGKAAAPPVPEAEAPEDRRPPLPKKGPKKRGGRFRLSSTSTDGPVVRSLKKQTPRPVASQATESAPVERKVATVSAGLDDLFGAATQGGRLSIPKKGKDNKKGQDEG